MNAFQSSQVFGNPVDVEAERKKVTDDVIADAISKDHPKVKDIVAEALLGLQERKHEERERSIKDNFAMERQVQEFKFRLETKDKDLNKMQSELSASHRKTEQALCKQKLAHEEAIQQIKEEMNAYIEKLQS